MKKFIKSIVLVLILSISAVSANAETSAIVSFNPENGIVTVTGHAQGNTIIKTLPFGTAESSINTTNLPTDIEQIFAGGDFTYTFTMPDAAPYGKYSVYVIDSGKDDDSFMYYDPTAADLIIPLLNAQTTAADLAAKIDENAASLGIDKDDALYSENLGSAANILFNAFKPFSNSNSFYRNFNSCIAMSDMGGATKSEIEELLFKYQQNLEINYSTDYQTASSALQNDMCMLFSNMNFVKEFADLKADGVEVNFANLYARTKALSAVRNADSWSTIRNAFVTDYNSVLGLIMSANSSYNSDMESSVFIELAGKAPFASFSDLKTKFNASVSYVIQQNNTGEDSSSGSGNGGGGGGGGSVSVSSKYVNPEEEYDAVQSTQNGETVIPISFTAPTLRNERAEYADVFVSNWEYDAVSKLGGSGIVSGYEDGSFRSGSAITRAEFTKLIVSAFDIQANKTEFEDVSETDWYYPFVSVAAGSGIVNGYDGRFNPDAQISREDAAVIMYRISVALDKNYYGDFKFEDLSDVSVYAITAVRGLASAGIVNGDNNRRFNPKGQLTRAEAAQLLYNFISEL